MGLPTGQPLTKGLRVVKAQEVLRVVQLLKVYLFQVRVVLGLLLLVELDHRGQVQVLQILHRLRLVIQQTMGLITVQPLRTLSHQVSPLHRVRVLPNHKVLLRVIRMVVIRPTD